MDPHDFVLMGSQMGNGILAQVKEQLKDEWDSVPQETKDDLEKLALRVGELTAKKLTGQDVDRQMALVMSTVKDFELAGKFATKQVAVKAQQAFWEGVKRVGETLGSFLGAFARAGLKGIAGI